MELLRESLDQREIELTLRVILNRKLPNDLINVIIGLNSKGFCQAFPVSFHSDIKSLVKHLGYSATSGGVHFLNAIVISLILDLTPKFVMILKQSRTNTITSRGIQNTFCILLKGEFRKMAVASATQALTCWNANFGVRDRKKHQRYPKVTKLATSKVDKVIRCVTKKDVQVGAGGPVYLAAVLDFIVSKILESASKDNDEKITTESIIRGYKNDADLKKLFHELVI